MVGKDCNGLRDLFKIAIRINTKSLIYFNFFISLYTYYVFSWSVNRLNTSIVVKESHLWHCPGKKVQQTKTKYLIVGISIDQYGGIYRNPGAFIFLRCRHFLVL